MGTIVKCVEVHVLTEKVGSFIEATLSLAQKTRQESGNLRFDINQSETHPDVFFFEAYENMEAIGRHKSTDYYKRWCQIAEPMMKGARKTTNCRIVFSDQLAK